MKTALLITLFVGSFAMAAQPQFSAEVSPVNQKIKAVRLMDSGELQIENFNGAMNTVKLNEGNVQPMQFAARILNQAPVVTDQHAAICMIIMPSFTRQILSIRNEKGTDLYAVLTTQSCALSTYTHPKNQNDLLNAEILKAELIVLANQYAAE